MHSVALPHDWLTWRLAGGGPRDAGGDPSLALVTDRGDASGTGYFSPAASAWLPDYAARALGKPVALPRVAAPAEVAGRTPWGAAISAGTGDNMGAALGMGLRDGDVAVSIGTSGTAYAVTSRPSADPTGLVSGFADATGHFLPLSATLNAARVLDVTARMLGVTAAGLSDLALKAEAGAGGLVLLPYLDGERTPNRPTANGVLRGLTTANATPENLARAAVEAVLCSLADAVDGLRPCGITPARIVLTGGAAKSEAVRAIAPAVFGLPVAIPEAAEYVALGAARQAAWALSGDAEPPAWAGRPSATHEASATPWVREQYAALRDDAAAWQVAFSRRRVRGGRDAGEHHGGGQGEQAGEDEQAAVAARARHHKPGDGSADDLRNRRRDVDDAQVTARVRRAWQHHHGQRLADRLEGAVTGPERQRAGNDQRPRGEPGQDEAGRRHQER